MAYETNTASGSVDLLQKLVTWLQGRGYTVNMSQAEGSGWRAHLSKGSVYVNLRALANESVPFVYNAAGAHHALVLYLGTGYNGANAWRDQAGGPVQSGTSNTVGAQLVMPGGSIPAYHFLDDGNDNITIVVEYSAGVFQHMGWGSLVKAGSFTGGAYFFASGPCDRSSYFQEECPCADSYSCVQTGTTSYFRADVDAFTGKWLGMRASAALTGKFALGQVCGGNLSGVGPSADIPNYASNPTVIDRSFQSAQVSSQNGQINLAPLHIFAARDDVGVSLLGRVPGVYYTNATDRGYDKASVLQIGSDDYLLFPKFAVKKVS